MKRQNNKKGNLKKKRKYNDVENDNYYEDEQNESENILLRIINKPLWRLKVQTY